MRAPHQPPATRIGKGAIRSATRDAALWTTQFCVSPLKSFLVRRGGSLSPRSHSGQTPRRGEIGMPEYAAYCQVATYGCCGGIPDTFTVWRRLASQRRPISGDLPPKTPRQSPLDGPRRRPNGMGVPEGAFVASKALGRFLGVRYQTLDHRRRASVTQPEVSAVRCQRCRVTVPSPTPLWLNRNTTFHLAGAVARDQPRRRSWRMRRRRAPAT